MNRYLLRQCLHVSSPIFFGYIAIGIPFGLMIVNAGYPWWVALVMSLTMYTGAGQYIAVGLFAAGAPLTEIVVAELFVSIRHIVYGLSLVDKFKDTGKWRPYLIFSLTDETYALLTGITPPKGVPAGTFYGLISLLNQSYWVAGAVVGAVACNVLQHYNLTQYLSGIDFALTALFVVILMEQIEKSHDIVPPLTGGVAALAAVILCRLGVLPSSNIILVAIVFALAAIVLMRARQFARGQEQQKEAAE